VAHSPVKQQLDFSWSEFRLSAGCSATGAVRADDGLSDQRAQRAC
jgi:hypothetical protein